MSVGLEQRLATCSQSNLKFEWLLTVKSGRLVFVPMKHCLDLEGQCWSTVDAHVLCVSFGATQ